MGAETLAYAATGFSALGAVDKALSARNAAKDSKNVQRETDRRAEDTSFRQEATYRYKREMLQGAIEDFYKKKGWELPKALPGAFTTRALPGEAPLYSDYDIPRPETYYEPLDPGVVDTTGALEDGAPQGASPQVDTTAIPKAFTSQPLTVDNVPPGYFGEPQMELAPQGAKRLDSPQMQQRQALIGDEELRKLSTPYGYL